MSSLCGNSTYSSSSAMFVMGIMRLFRGNCPRGVQNRISLEVAMLCNKSEARSLDTALERLLKTSLILGSSSSLSTPQCWSHPVISSSSHAFKTMSAVSLRAFFHLHDCRNDRVRKNGLGLISITASFRGNLPFPGENHLVLFTMAV